MMAKTEGVRRLWDKYKYAALVALIGAALLLWPKGEGGLPAPAAEDGGGRDAREVQAELEGILGTIDGVGQVRVMLTAESDGERQLAQNTELRYSGATAAPEDYSRRSETVLTGGDAPMVTRTTYPTYRGALVVCQGGDDAAVRLAVTEAVAALTGLSADRVAVAKCQ